MRLCAKIWADNSAPRPDSVEHGAEAWKRLGPLSARRKADDSHSRVRAEAQPLHDGDRRVVLAAGRLEPRLIAGRAIDADRLGHGDAAVTNAGDGRCDLLGEAAAIFRRSRGLADQAD